MATEMMGPMVIGYSLDSFLMLASGIFYLICALIVFRTYKKDPSELMAALLAFLIFQAVNMFFMGLEMHTMNMIYGNIASLAVFIGSAYMLKFPTSSFSEGVRKNIFLASIIILLAIYAWFVQTAAGEMILMNFTLWYDLVINGIVVGGSIVLVGLKTVERWHKVKAIGGGAGIISCCVVSNGAMLGGAIITSSIFAFLAPVIILSTLGFSKNK